MAADTQTKPEAAPEEGAAEPTPPPPPPEPEPPDEDVETEPHALPPHLKDLPPEFVTEKLGKHYVLFIGLVHVLHEKSKGRFSVKNKVVQFPTAENGHQAIVQSDLTIWEMGKDGVTRIPLIEVTEFGDADAGNVNSAVGKHLIRMAVTRAQARAMRVATDIGLTSADEMGGGRGRAPQARSGTNNQQRSFTPRVQQDGQARSVPSGQQSGGGGAAPRKVSEDPFKIGDTLYDRPALQRKYREWVARANRAGVQFQRTSEGVPLPVLGKAAVALAKEVVKAEKENPPPAAEPEPTPPEDEGEGGTEEVPF